MEQRLFLAVYNSLFILKRSQGCGFVGHRSKITKPVPTFLAVITLLVLFILYVDKSFSSSGHTVIPCFCPFHRSLSANTLSFAATDSSTEPFRFLTSTDTPLFLFTLSRLPLTSRRYDPAGLGGRGGPVLRLVEWYTGKREDAACFIELYAE